MDGRNARNESDADAEYEEIDLKLRTILSAFGA